MSIFSFLFSSSDTGSARGAKTDGKGVTELKSENNVDTAKNLKQAPDVAAQSVIQNKRKERRNRHIKRLNTPYQRRSQKSDNRYLQKRHMEVQNITQKAKTETRYVTKNKNISTPKAISNFIQSLDPAVQEAVKNDIIKKMNAQKEQFIQKAKDSKVEKIPQTDFSLRPLEPAQAKRDIRETIEQKRGLKRQPKRFAMLRAAKQVAQKARQIVKDFKLRITGKKAKQMPVQQQKTNQKQRIMPKNNIKNMKRTDRGR